MESKSWQIVFFGEDSFSNVVLHSLIDTEYEIKAVITPLYNNLIYKKLEFTCIQNGIPFYRVSRVNSDETAAIVRNTGPDLCITAHFERLIKKPILGIPKFGFINLHPSLLPNYRGMSPQHWPIINGEKETGITVHYLDESADTGDIILQRTISLNDSMYVSDLQNIWMKEYRTIIPEAIERMKSECPVISQRKLKGSYYGKLREEDCRICPEEGVHRAYNLIRGVSLPYMGARLDNKIIYRAHIMRPGEKVDPSEILHFSDGDLVMDMYKTIV